MLHRHDSQYIHKAVVVLNPEILYQVREYDSIHPQDRIPTYCKHSQSIPEVRTINGESAFIVNELTHTVSGTPPRDTPKQAVLNNCTMLFLSVVGTIYSFY